MENSSNVSPIEQRLSDIVEWCNRMDFQIRSLRNAVNATLEEVAKQSAANVVDAPEVFNNFKGISDNVEEVSPTPPKFEPQPVESQSVEQQPENVEAQPQPEAVEPQPQPEAVESQPEVEPIQPKPEPEVKQQLIKKPVPDSSLTEDEERTFGVKWMAVIGVLIAVIGFSLLVKYLIEKDLIGPAAIVSFGYIVSLVMVVLAFRVSETRKVLKDTLIIGGSTFGWLVTWLAYGHYDMFPSAVTVTITLAISLGLSVYAYLHDNQVMFNFALAGFIFSPMVAGYSLRKVTHHDGFWMLFTLAYNIGLVALYRSKKWASSYVIAFLATTVIEGLICFTGTFYSPTTYVVYFALLSAALYAGITILYNSNKDLDTAFPLAIIASVLFFSVFTKAEFDNSNNSTAFSYLIYSVALGITAFVFRKLKRELTGMFVTPISLSCILFNVAFLMFDFPSSINHWLPFLFSFDVVLLVTLYRLSKADVFKGLAVLLMWANFILLYFFTPFFGRIHHWNHFLLVFNIDFLGQLEFVAVLVYLYAIRFLPRNMGYAFFIVLSLFLSVVFENYNFWHLINYHYSDEVLQGVTHLCVTIMGLLGFSIIMVNLPKKVECLKNFRILGHYGLLVSVAYFCVSGIYVLDSLRDYLTTLPASYHAWRYASVALTGVALFFIIKNRKAEIFNNYDVVSDLVAAAAIIWLVAAEINNMFHLYDLQVNKYRMFVTLWFTVSSVGLFALGLKYRLKYLRIFGFVMTGITVLKLFFIDIWKTELIVKAIVFVAIGLLFLLISYIYSKYFKSAFEGDPQNKEAETVEDKTSNTLNE